MGGDRTILRSVERWEIYEKDPRPQDSRNTENTGGFVFRSEVK